MDNLYDPLSESISQEVVPGGVHFVPGPVKSLLILQQSARGADGTKN